MKVDDLRQQLAIHVLGPYGDMDTSLEDLFYRAGETRRQLEAVNDMLDLMGAPRYVHPDADTRLSPRGRLECMRDSGNLTHRYP